MCCSIIILLITKLIIQQIGAFLERLYMPALSGQLRHWFELNDSSQKVCFLHFGPNGHNNLSNNEGRQSIPACFKLNSLVAIESEF